MNDMETEYNLYAETKVFIDANELESWGLEAAMSGGYCESSFPEAATSLGATRNISMERSRRRNLNEKFYALRNVVPNVTKLDKASIITDAIDYIQQLQEQERTVLAELSQLESLREKKASLGELEFGDLPFLQRKKKRTAPGSPISSPIEVVELRVREMDEKTMVVSITCTKKRHTMIKVCELFESLDLKFITANITSVSGNLSYTLLVETEEMDSAQLKEKITTAISELYGSRNPISSIQ
ncbi:unnamed protein product [Musa textilis]